MTTSPSTEIAFDIRVSDHPVPDAERAEILAMASIAARNMIGSTVAL